MEVHHFFPSHKIEEDLVKSLIRAGFEMIECPLNLKQPDLKESVFRLLEQCLQRYKDELKYIMSQNAGKVINLLYAQDNLAKPLSEFVGLMNTPTQENPLANEIIRELTKQIFHNDSSHETIGIKNVAKFLSKLSKQAPKAVYQNIGSLLGFFDCESYLLRQSLIKILSNVIQRVLSPRELDAA